MSASGHADSQSLADWKDVDVKKEPFGYPTMVCDASSYSGLDAVGSTEEISRVSYAEACGSVLTMTHHDEKKDSAGLKPKKENRASNPVATRSDDNAGKLHFGSPKVEPRKIVSVVGDYDSMLSEFDQFAYRGGGEPVGYGYGIGDMVWGKVKSHPWWPGQIFNELLATSSVRSSKREGHVLVAFFGDNSYGWFDPAELVPFVECFVEKSNQSSSRAFSKAVKEAVDELSRRKSLGLACRCRNEFNFWPFSVEGYFTVYAGDHEPGAYSLSQINRSREEFRPREMLNFVHQLALRPKSSHLTIEFIKNKATVLAFRKALYEEFDDTYAQAFGTVPDRPSRPTAPVSVDPSGASLSGRLVIAEALGKGKLSLHNQREGQTEKDKYLFKKRDESVDMNPKKTSGEVVQPQLIDALGLTQQSSISGFDGVRTQLTSNNSNIVFGDTKPSEDSGNPLEIRKKKLNVAKQLAIESNNIRDPSGETNKKRKKETSSQGPVVDLLAPSLNLVKKKRKKVMRGGMSGSNIPHLQFGKVNSGIGEVQVPQKSLDGPVSCISTSSSSIITSQQVVETRKVELQALVRDLRALALDPFHAIERNHAGGTRRSFLKYRSIVYQKSLVLSSSAEKETVETTPASISYANKNSEEKSTTKLVRPVARPGDPTKGGKKRVLSDLPEIAKKKKVDESKDAHSKKLIVDSEDNKKKKLMNDSKFLPMEKKNPRKSAVVSSAPNSVVASRNEKKPIKVKRRTALMLKFPKGSALPSGAELAAKFARFGPLEYSSTRVYWQTDTCRVVFLYKIDAEAALKFAASGDNLFGYENVKSHIRDAAFEGTEMETAKIRKEEANDMSMEPRTAVAPKIGSQHQPAVMPLKSILKKQSTEEGGSVNGSGGGRRVKFLLSGDGNGNSNSNNPSSIEQNSNTTTTTATTTHSLSMDFSSKNKMGKLNPEPGVVFPNNNLLPAAAVAVDISGELLGLLNRCRDVVNDVRRVLGYVPYHSL